MQEIGLFITPFCIFSLWEELICFTVTFTLTVAVLIFTIVYAELDRFALHIIMP